MIYVANETVRVDGKVIDVLAELTAVMVSLMIKANVSDNLIAHCIKVARDSVNEIEAEKAKFREDFIKNLFSDP